MVAHHAAYLAGCEHAADAARPCLIRRLGLEVASCGGEVLPVRKALTAGMFMSAAKLVDTAYDPRAPSSAGINTYQIVRSTGPGALGVLHHLMRRALKGTGRECAPGAYLVPPCINWHIVTASLSGRNKLAVCPYDLILGQQDAGHAGVAVRQRA